MGLLKELKNEIVNAAKETADEAAMTVVASAVVVGAHAIAKGTMAGVRLLDKGAAAVDKGKRAFGNKLEKAAVAAEDRHYKKEQKYLSKKKENNCLYIQRVESSNGTDDFTVTDTDGNPLYSCIAKTKRLTRDYSMMLNQCSNGHLIATVGKRKTNSNPLFKTEDHLEYALKIDHEEVGVINSELVDKKQVYSVQPYGWSIKVAPFRTEYHILNGKEEICHLSKRTGYGKETYIMDYPDNDEDLVLLLILLTMVSTQ